MQRFHHTAQVNFLPFMPDSLHPRLRRNQICEKAKVVKVLRVEDRGLVERWAAELCAADAWLESLSLVHADLRPTNILLDERDHLKLTDFDCVDRIGEASSGSCPSWARFYPDPETGHGHFGLYGAKTEQFAIGSVLFCMTRGHEPYEHPEDDSPDLDVVDLFQRGIFPHVDAKGDALDFIIEGCWNGRYESIKDLAEAATHLPGAADMGGATTFSADYCAQKRDECCRLLQEGLVEWDAAKESDETKT